jgi:hypothetical protein
MNNREWLDSLKAGDEVAIHTRNWVDIVKIERMTQTQIIIDQYRFYVSNGYAIGRRLWNQPYIGPVTDEIRLKIKHRNLVYKISNTKFDDLPLEKLEAIMRIIDGEAKAT